jgi:chromosome partitioning protein
MSMVSVLIANSKGGCGKTTISTNLAVAYASRGFNTWLIDADRQQSARRWAKRRPAGLAPIECRRWQDDPKLPAAKGLRVIVDAPAGVRTKDFGELLRLCDLAIIPVLPSGFDFDATRRMLDKIQSIKPVARGKKPVAVVVNRYRKGGKAGKLLLDQLEDVGYPPVAIIGDRSLYPDFSVTGEGLFERNGARFRQAAEEWEPLIRYIESFA